MNVVYKYEFPILGPDTVLRLPYARELALVGVQQQGLVTMWAIVDDDELAETELVAFRVIGTGQPIEDEWLHVGSVIDGEGVWHLFEREVTE